MTRESAEHDGLVWGVGRRPLDRSHDRPDAPIRAMNRAPSQEWLTGGLRPGGGAPRAAAAEPAVSLRPGGPGAAGAGAGARSASTSSLRCAAVPFQCRQQTDMVSLYTLFS